MVLLISITAAAIGQKMAAKDTVFYDDFNGTSLNRHKWNVEVTGITYSQELEAYVDSVSTVEVSGGMLILKALYHPGHTSKEHHTYDLLSGRVNTSGKEEFTYGTLAARMKLPSGGGLWPAFWALGEGLWPGCGEIDMMEAIGDSTWVSHAVHGPGYSGKTPIFHRSFFPEGMDITQWHVYSVDWTTRDLTFRVDGKTTYHVTRAIIEKYGKWMFDQPKYLILNLALGGGYPHSVYAINEPYYGLLPSTLAKIKAGEAKVYIDWVLVTRPKNKNQ
jgi:beta-glucanase (GH16 family)